ncbi:branched-chain amino acid aminotransferase [Streptomyces sp. NPDC050560]|uniref:branched-chain amino acid aminotransferase n=1 Tax=Streptomyces sp. NPDC050560 TaxID=3365630 RepID=UPI003790C5D1
MTTPTIELKPSSSLTPAADRERILANPGFGRYFTDHMVTVRWTEGRGWHDAELVPYAPLSMDPANMTLHYAQTIFEGLKAYRRTDGTIATFRPEQNARRFQRSARRLAMPEVPEDLFLGAVDALVRQDGAWVPPAGEESLYIRPFMFATEVGLGVHPAGEFLFMVIASPAGAYFKGGVKPVSVWVSEDYVRAAPGGTGEAKAGGNYASSLLAQAEATARGCDQVVWLDGLERRYIEEMGTNNLFFVYGDRVVTPSFSGSLLAGVTRDSVLAIAADLGYEVAEERISLDDWRRASEDGSLTEVFGCGTAAVITPVGEVHSARGSWKVAGGESGEATMKIRSALLDIQTGAAPDTHGWMRPLD